jgi:hypothetical protein
MNYKNFYANTKKLLATIDEKIGGIEINASNRNKLSAALFDTAREHAKAIIVLLEDNNKLYASVYALARPLFESFVRAAWIQHCASDEQIDDIIQRDVLPLSFGLMLNAVEEKQKWEKTLTQLKESAWKTMHSYTHGGTQIIFRRFKGDYIEHNIDEDEIIGLLQIVALIAFLSSNEIIGMSRGYDKEIPEFKDLFEDLCTWCFTDLSKNQNN